MRRGATGPSMLRGRVLAEETAFKSWRMRLRPSRTADLDNSPLHHRRGRHGRGPDPRACSLRARAMHQRRREPHPILYRRLSIRRFRQVPCTSIVRMFDVHAQLLSWTTSSPAIDSTMAIMNEHSFVQLGLERCLVWCWESVVLTGYSWMHVDLGALSGMRMVVGPQV
jgi:hypothetical protein